MKTIAQAVLVMLALSAISVLFLSAMLCRFIYKEWLD